MQKQYVSDNVGEDSTSSLGWVRLYFISNDSTPSSRTIYIKRNTLTYAVLHTDITGATKLISLPAQTETGTEYLCITDNGEQRRICIYPYVVNVHYIDKTTEEK